MAVDRAESAPLVSYAGILTMFRLEYRCLTLVALIVWAVPIAAEDVKNVDPYPQVELKTSLGDMTIELDNVRAPKSSENFLRYVNEKYYDGMVFHRIQKDFIVQAGRFDELMNEKKGLYDPIPCEWENGLSNERGTIAVARGDKAASGQTQFFINVKDNPLLDKAWPGKDNAGYAVFGRVVQGLDVLDAIAKAKTVLEHEKFPDERWVVPDPPIVITKASVVPVSSARKPEPASTGGTTVMEAVPQPDPVAKPRNEGAPAPQPRKE